MSQTFDVIFQSLISLRRAQKVVIKDTLTEEEIDAIQRRQHFEQTFMFNSIHGRFGSKDNALTR